MTTANVEEIRKCAAFGGWTREGLGCSETMEVFTRKSGVTSLRIRVEFDSLGRVRRATRMIAVPGRGVVETIENRQADKCLMVCVWLWE